jgi:hypothetical protein
LYGISQNPDTNDYILVFNWTSGNEKIDDFIQERLCEDIAFEWIPYIQFDQIKETGKNGLITVYSAIWRDCPLQYNLKKHNNKHTINANKKVALKCLHNLQNPIEFVINKV